MLITNRDVCMKCVRAGNGGRECMKKCSLSPSISCWWFAAGGGIMTAVPRKYDQLWVGSAMHCPVGHRLELTTPAYQAQSTTVAGGGGG